MNVGERPWYLVGKIATLKFVLFHYLRKLCFKITKALKIQLDFICSNRIYSLKFESCILYFWYFGKTQKFLESSCQHGEELLVAPLVNFCSCFCTVLYPQQTANLAWIKSWFSSPLCPAWMTAVKSGTRKAVQVPMCWVRAAVTGCSYDESNWIRPWRISLSLSPSL